MTMSRPRHRRASSPRWCRAQLDVAAVDGLLPQVVVADTERALAAFAAAMQRERTAKVIAITGSNGKTSVKTLLLSILQRVGSTYANPGNRNNEIGLPLAVLDAPDDAQFAIYEMGAGKPGDIAYLTAIARPDVALVNNIAPAHLERMGSLLGVAETKGAIYDALTTNGVAAINADDAFAPFFAEKSHGRRLIRFGLDATADVTARDVQVGHRWLALHPGHAAGRDAKSHSPCPVATTCSMRSRPLRSRWAPGPGWTRSAQDSKPRRPSPGRMVSHRLEQWRGADRRQLQREPGFAACGDRDARGRIRDRRRAKPGWCSATCASSAPMPKRCISKPGVARRTPGSRACTRWAR